MLIFLLSILTAKYLSSGCFCPHCWAPSSLPNTSVQDASALTAGLRPHCQIPQFRMLLPSIWAPSSLPNTSVQDASALHLGSILTAKYLISGCLCPSSGLHPHCQIPQFRMLLTSLVGSILTAKYLSSGCFCPHCWAPSSLPNTSVQDASALTAGLRPHCQIPQFRMLLPSIWAPSSLPNNSVQDASALHLGSILTANYLSSGCFCPLSGSHPHCQIPQSRMLLPSIWAPSLLPSTSVQDASALYQGSILTAKYLSSGCFCPPSGLHPHCKILQFMMLLRGE